MQWTDSFDLFLFDLDGLLVDTEKLHFAAYQTLCKRYDFELPWELDEYLEIAHGSADGLKEALLPHLEGAGSWESLYAEKKKILQSLLISKEVSLMPGVESLLKELESSRAKRCVATHSAKDQVEAIKEALPILKTIPLWITREDYESAKPAPDAYLKAMEVLYDHGDRVVGFEDSLRGIHALNSAGVEPILICDPSHPQMKEVTSTMCRHFSSFSAIPRSHRF